MIPFNPFPRDDNSVTSCGNVVVVLEKRPGLEGLDDRGSIIITESPDECMSLGTGRLIIGTTGGGERPSGCSTGIGEGCVRSNRRETDNGEGVPP